MTKPYPDPHPAPWYSGYLEARIRYRFQCFDDEPWFKPLVVAYCVDIDRDGDGGEILESLEETARQRGIKIPARECGDCEEPKEEITAENRTCGDCQRLDLEAEHEERERRAREEARRARLTPEQRRLEDERAREVMRLCVHGLVTRDVQ